MEMFDKDFNLILTIKHDINPLRGKLFYYYSCASYKLIR